MHYKSCTKYVLTIYIEHLASKLTCYKSVLNALSAIKYYYLSKGKPVKAFKSFQVKTLCKALPFTMNSKNVSKVIITPKMLIKWLKLCTMFKKQQHVVRFALIAGFCGFLRRSNLAPESHGKFDVTRHTTKGDVTCINNLVKIKLKWTKTLQFAANAVICLPVLQGINNPSNLYLKMLKHTRKAHAGKPLLQFNDGNTLPASYLSNAITQLAQASGLNPKGYSIHTLRRSGATASYLQGASALDIQLQGTWKSDAFITYIRREHMPVAPVQQALALAFNG